MTGLRAALLAASSLALGCALPVPCTPASCGDAVCGLDGECGAMGVPSAESTVRLAAIRWTSSELPEGSDEIEVGGPRERRAVLVFHLPAELAVHELQSAVLTLAPAHDAPLAHEAAIRVRSFPARADAELLLRAGRNAPGPSIRRSIVRGRRQHFDITRLIEARRSLLARAERGADIAIVLDTRADDAPFRWASPTAMDPALHPTLTLRID